MPGAPGRPVDPRPGRPRAVQTADVTVTDTGPATLTGYDAGLYVAQYEGISAVRAITQHTLGGPEVLTLVERPVPEPGRAEALVRVRAAGVNPVDWQTRAGGGVATRLGPPPFTVGWDLAGEVVSLGADAGGLRVGDRVFGMSRFPAQAAAYAEYAVVPVRDLAPVPARLGLVHAAALPLAGLTAWTALTAKAAVRAGDRVLIHAAAGGVGHLAVQIAKSLGAHVTGTARAEKHDFLKGLGADEVVDHRTTPIETITGGFDAILELGGGDNAARSLRLLRPGGVLVDIAHHAPRGLGHGTGLRVATMLVKPDRAALREVARLAATGHLTPVLDRTYPLSDAAVAHRRGERRTTTGKLVLTAE
ncbi:NADP-dependent oxidoreductase [Streptomyces griseoviridis]|uniref:NADPH:quinone reductase-like Zn-dependent oxidoreductase n=1 Tax=Streptomyces griseoviridis TaxID=45398 RepID=A0ABT9L994_STRGD|nr:NADP-dependent oxidoreductase [Streptomyces griseoviridis]MDP9680282.1 NADPH:quinone reductase-like Zn-dependent oxidoreductase [Streptomyces griseoviridis]GGT09744.1 NADPH:quinone reductase [Streptomyces griseoviridis]